ncbi:LPS export ABC transporter periplasmic protein LptC [Aureispira anguillae]|uniref:LPS export ABC transporter periplasmic protein LptC n=1 Tax=Aureispira anguillae TaxID=2864201 RepID=A0A915YJB2_9BACT|nr:LPS export ABC transporter periplasmic protein LptC [Aureispira anguillae]BDS14115.1 LPS export ABC transporter periplasmic protein LptC [Aureispira anguillae]
MFRATINLKYGIFLFLLLNSACSGNEMKDLDNITLKDDVGIERAEGIELLYSDSSVVRVAIHAPTLLRYIARDTPKQVFPDGVDADFYNDQHIQTSKMTAKYAEQFEKERKVYLRDSVFIWNNKNEMLETEELIWDEPAEKIYSTKYVKITTPTQIIEGYGFKSNLDFTDWEIYNVSGQMEQKNMMDSPF